ncbi:hypothetical protein D3C84_717700 [compost metagenome]
MANMLRRCRLVVRHHPQSRGQRFKHYIAEGLGQARKHKYIPRRIMTGQGFASLRSAENRFGQLAFHQQALRAIAHHDQLQGALWISGLEGVEAAFEQSEVFLRCQPPNMDNGDVFFTQPPLLT